MVRSPWQGTLAENSVDPWKTFAKTANSIKRDHRWRVSCSRPWVREIEQEVKRAL
jgi:hypothetical protein